MFFIFLKFFNFFKFFDKKVRHLMFLMCFWNGILLDLDDFDSEKLPGICWASEIYLPSQLWLYLCS